MERAQGRGILEGAWSRRRFLACAATAAGAALLTDAARPAAASPPESADLRGAGAPAPEMPIQGSPWLLATAMPADAWAAPAAVSRDPILHFHVAGDLRDRLVLGIP